MFPMLLVGMRFCKRLESSDYAVVQRHKNKKANVCPQERGSNAKEGCCNTSVLPDFVREVLLFGNTFERSVALSLGTCTLLTHLRYIQFHTVHVLRAFHILLISCMSEVDHRSGGCRAAV